MTGNKPTSENGSENDQLDFDPESPDVEDPQVDPVEPAKTPAREKGTNDDYPPYDTK